MGYIRDEGDDAGIFQEQQPLVGTVLRRIWGNEITQVSLLTHFLSASDARCVLQRYLGGLCAIHTFTGFTKNKASRIELK